MRPSTEWGRMDGRMDGGRWWWGRGVATCKLTDGWTHAPGGAAAGSSMWAEEEKEQKMEGCQERRLVSGVKTFFFRVSFF